ncbi:MAG: NupC/NupG family nucleoside CNT transporter [Planctomycetota bacterium]|nr:NupC/NupG family nucleoside CNT transporter [Planctomycetota bacterium]
MTARFVGVLGLIVLLGIAWLISGRRRPIPWRMIASGLLLQILFAFIILRTDLGVLIFGGARQAVDIVLDFTQRGAGFIFGSLAEKSGPVGFVFAFQVLPTIIFFSALMSVLYHLGVMQKFVSGLAWMMRRTMRTSGAESLSVAANVFVGMTEAPLVVRPYIQRMTSSEMMTLMTGGFATIAGSVYVAYVQFGIDAGHLLAASLMSAPAALLISKILMPETETPATVGDAGVPPERKTVNLIDAAATGAGEGLRLALNVGAMLLAFVALIALADYLIAKVNFAVDEFYLGRMLGWNLRICPDDLAGIFGFLFGPVAWLMGVPAKDAASVGNLLGQKIAINEFVAYLSLAREMESGSLDSRSIIIATYALCGFANFGSVAIQIGGIGGIAPDRRRDLARFGLRAMAGGAIASFMTATIAGIFL